MGMSAVATIWRDGPSAFAFLVDDWDFLGPELVESGLAYHRVGLHIHFEAWEWRHEAGISTRVNDGNGRSAPLDCLYVACGLGPAQGVPENWSSLFSVRKRISQHAAALRKVVPFLVAPTAAELLSRCTSGGRAIE
jgi:hypothetical protein